MKVRQKITRPFQTVGVGPLQFQNLRRHCGVAVMAQNKTGNFIGFIGKISLNQFLQFLNDGRKSEPDVNFDL